jgi:hypothetical protein
LGFGFSLNEILFTQLVEKPKRSTLRKFFNHSIDYVNQGGNYENEHRPLNDVGASEVV